MNSTAALTVLLRKDRDLKLICESFIWSTNCLFKWTVQTNWFTKIIKTLLERQGRWGEFCEAPGVIKYEKLQYKFSGKHLTIVAFQL